MDPIAIASVALVVVVLLVLIYLSIRIVNEYDRLVVFRFGRTGPHLIKGPGIVFLIPIVDRPVRVDLREQFIEIPSQTAITRDNAPINIDFLIYWRIADPLKSVVNVAFFAGALQGIATTTLRAVIGDILLDDVLSKRDQINEVLRVKLDEQTERWGGKVTIVEIREIIPPRGDHRIGGHPPVHHQRRGGRQAVADPARRGRAAGRDPSRRGLQPGAGADLPGGQRRG